MAPIGRGLFALLAPLLSRSLLSAKSPVSSPPPSAAYPPSGSVGSPASSSPPASYPLPEPCYGNCSEIHDPSLIKRNDGTWFRFSTNGNIAIATAPAVTGPWEYKGAMLPQGSQISLNANQELWAPDVSKIGDTYYAYYAVSVIGSKNSDIGLASSPTMDIGSWTDHGSIGIPQSADYNLIDPNWFRKDVNSTAFLQFGSAWDALYQATLDPTCSIRAPDTPITHLAYNSTFPGDVDRPSITEGSFLFQWDYDYSGNTLYYLFFSNGACCNKATGHPDEPLAPQGDEYKVFVCRSDSPNGEFFDDTGASCLTANGGKLVLASHDFVYAPGGQGVMYDSTLKGPIIYYHYVNPGVGYDYTQFYFGFNYLDFSSGWPVASG